MCDPLANAPDYNAADIAATLAELDEQHAARLNAVRASRLLPWQVERAVDRLWEAYLADVARWEYWQSVYYS